jgi:ferredoxin
MKEKKITLRNKKRDLVKLTMMMNRQNMRFMPPVSALLESLDFLLSGDELKLLLLLGTDEYTIEQAQAASGMDSATFGPLFESLQRKGNIGMHYSDTGEERYSLHPFIVGWFEAHVSYLIGKPELKEFSRRWMEFYKTFRGYNFFPVRSLMNMSIRKAPVSNHSVGMVHETKDAKGKSIVDINRTVTSSDSKIYPTNSVNDLIHEYGTKSVIGQLKCMCRQVTTNIDDPCRFKFPDDGGCMGFGERMNHAIKYGYARRISMEEAFDVIQKVRDRGAIHTVFHEKDNAGRPQMGMCNCCWDCCGILRSYNMGALPLRYSSFYMAKISDGTKCTGCRKCEKYCPTAAISFADKKAVIDAGKCIGCGQCVHQCSFSAVELVEKKRTAFLPMLKKSEARIKV